MWSIDSKNTFLRSFNPFVDVPTLESSWNASFRGHLFYFNSFDRYVHWRLRNKKEETQKNDGIAPAVEPASKFPPMPQHGGGNTVFGTTTQAWHSSELAKASPAAKHLSSTRVAVQPALAAEDRGPQSRVSIQQAKPLLDKQTDRRAPVARDAIRSHRVEWPAEGTENEYLDIGSGAVTPIKETSNGVQLSSDDRVTIVPVPRQPSYNQATAESPSVQRLVEARMRMDRALASAYGSVAGADPSDGAGTMVSGSLQIEERRFSRRRTSFLSATNMNEEQSDKPHGGPSMLAVRRRSSVGSNSIAPETPASPSDIVFAWDNIVDTGGRIPTPSGVGSFSDDHDFTSAIDALGAHAVDAKSGFTGSGTMPGGEPTSTRPPEKMTSPRTGRGVLSPPVIDDDAEYLELAGTNDEYLDLDGANEEVNASGYIPGSVSPSAIEKRTPVIVGEEHGHEMIVHVPGSATRSPHKRSLIVAPEHHKAVQPRRGSMYAHSHV